MYRRRIPFPGMALATFLGVAGGVYIYKPMFRPLNKNMTHSTINQEDAIVVQSGEKLEHNNINK
ncbi:protein PIGBOS1 [Anguilla anguilla]|uniref:Uncharacterized protein n=1 Tax=Anguilla anguilla TaxID=7936 RepID=A0A0E9X7R4_ANGAN|nr:protein PIGBOS1 [Anguilla anguilla]